MEVLMLILVVWTTGSQCQATWKPTPLTPEEEQRCCSDTHTAVLKVSQLLSRLEQQKQEIDLLRQEQRRTMNEQHEDLQQTTLLAEKNSADSNTTALQISQLLSRLEQQNQVVNYQRDELQRQISQLQSTVDNLGDDSKSCQREEKKMAPQLNCQEHLNRGETQSGMYAIYSERSSDAKIIWIYCDMETDGGGWLVFQRRKDGSQDFALTREQYAAGFGDPNGEFWLGNRYLNLLTTHQSYELRVDVEDDDRQTRYAKYGTFIVGSESGDFRLTIRDYSGSAGDSMAYHDGQIFSTWNDCAAKHKGGWWYNDCHHANLNGLYLNGFYTGVDRGIVWSSWKGYQYSLQFTEMKIRPL